jgi:hypothetical protein
VVPLNQVIDVLSAIVVVGGILVLTKPGSQGPALVQNLTAGFSNALGTATGGISGPVSYK